MQLGDRKFYSDKMKALMKTSKWKKYEITKDPGRRLTSSEQGSTGKKE